MQKRKSATARRMVLLRLRCGRLGRYIIRGGIGDPHTACGSGGFLGGCWRPFEGWHRGSFKLAAMCPFRGISIAECANVR
jgi:hypothetical protein